MNSENLVIRTALIQLLVGANKQENIQRAVEKIAEAARNNAKIISLPVDFLFLLWITAN